ncbi:hypothetical protein SAMN02745126_05287 [Enhydrobacter aerosaccus]|uniref:Uncharacterized protein n=1 Tax=Enhydrobacter aerosaccus TaxID=225324 RepID=A0A1T4SWI3_9HYPH|nr:hypothetical protein SAMN02745126_05287 [Enhydrobacter aerosaccus]
MTYVTLLVQTALIASVFLAGLATSADHRIESRSVPWIAVSSPVPSASHQASRLHCRLYFGCAPEARSLGESPALQKE